MTLSCGFIGLGHMGGAMARRLLQSGPGLVVHDLQAAAVQALVALGAQPAASARAVADRAEIVFLSLPSAQATREVAAGLAGAARVRVVVETSTVGPAAVRELAAQLQGSNIAIVDAPVSGGPSFAQAGRLSMMHAGAPQDVALALPAMRCIAGRLFDVGAQPGLAQLCKLVNNAISAAGMVAACEAMVLGAKAGLDPDTLLEAVNAGSGRNAATLDKFPRAILPGSFDYGGPLGLMLKDLSLFIEQAHAHGVKTLMAPAALQAWAEAVERSGAQADYSAVIRHMEIDAGASVRSRGKAGD